MTSSKRRTFLKQAGTVSSIGTITLAAGCSGDGGSDGGSGGGTATGSGSTEVVISSAPTPTTQLEVGYMKDSGLLEGVMGELGYTPKVQLTWEELSLFMGGKADIAPSVGSVEAARLSVNRDQQLLAHAVSAPQHTGLYVRKGSEYDPEVAGDKQTAVDALVSNDAKFGIGGWGLGTIPGYRLIFQEKYGYRFEEGGDFNVVTAEFPTLSRLVAKGQIDAGGSGPPYGLWSVRDQVKPLLWNQEELPDTGFPRNTVAIANGVTRKSFAEENKDAVAAWFAIEKRAAEHVSNNIDSIAGESKTQELLNAESKEQAKWILEFRYQAKHTENKLPATLQDVKLDDEYIQKDKEAITQAQEMGAVPGGWEESFGYVKHDIQKYYEMTTGY